MPRDTTVIHKISAIIFYLLDLELYFLDHLLMSLSMAHSASLVKNNAATTMGTTDLLNHIGLWSEHQNTRALALGTGSLSFTTLPATGVTSNLLLVLGHLDNTGLDIIQGKFEFEDWLRWSLGAAGWWPPSEDGLKRAARAKGVSPASKQISQTPKSTEALLGGIMLCSLFSIGYDGVCFVDLLELVGVAALVWMVLESKLPVSLFDIILARVRRDT
tara:strand:- start:1521 stop:2171 length:651 start_codon:yes stop_codon:yes gene_type:complete